LDQIPTRASRLGAESRCIDARDRHPYGKNVQRLE
jgi:hypothetical protein